MSSDVNTLMEMGFPQNRASAHGTYAPMTYTWNISEKALAKTGYKGAQVAMDWLFDHQDDPDIDDPFEVPQGHILGKEETTEQKVEAANEAPIEQAKSLKCDDCGKLIKSEIDAQAHAARTGHSNFSESTEEIKPLTEEEKKEQLARIQERMNQKRMEKQEQEKKDQIQREKLRRAAGKDMSQAKQKMEEQEMKKLAEAKRREKEEAKLARQKVREEIERDKRERAAKFAKKSDQPAVAGATSPPTAAVPATTTPEVKKEYDQCRLQIKLTNGQALTQSFGAKEELAAVRLYVEMNRSDGSGPFTLMTSFPRKVFSDEDMEKPLSELGLVPSAVLIVSKKQ